MTAMGQPPTGTDGRGQLAVDDAPRRGGPLGVGWGWWVALSALGAIIALIALLAIDDASEPTQIVGTAAILAQPDEYEGDRVVVTGRIDELLTDRAVALGSDLAADDLLVLIHPEAFVGGYGIGGTMAAPLPAGEAYDAGDVVQFAGTIRDFDADAISDELGLVLNDELFDAWQGEPALVVDRLDVATVGRLGSG